MILAAAIVGCSLILSAAILFAGLTNQRTQVVYVPATSQELMVELLKMTTKEISGLTKKVESVTAKVSEPTNSNEQTLGRDPVVTSSGDGS